MTRILTALILAIVMSGCSLLPEQIDETKAWSAQKLFTKAKEAVSEGNYEQGIKLFEKLESRYPYGSHASQAQLEVAYAYYKDNEPESALAALDRFIQQHPAHPHIDYALYLKGMVNFIEDNGLLARLGSQNLSERDPRAAHESFLAFKVLVQRYPDSKYSEDARGRMHYLVNALGAHELHVAHYYFTRGAYVAAANRAKYVIEHYAATASAEEALAVMAQSYGHLGMKDLQADALRVLKQNYPNSVWLSGPKANAPWWKLW
jgi:outer membrane protein assembly factor BamD